MIWTLHEHSSDPPALLHQRVHTGRIIPLSETHYVIQEVALPLYSLLYTGGSSATVSLYLSSRSAHTSLPVSPTSHLLLVLCSVYPVLVFMFLVLCH